MTVPIDEEPNFELQETNYMAIWRKHQTTGVIRTFVIFLYYPFAAILRHRKQMEKFIFPCKILLKENY